MINDLGFPILVKKPGFLNQIAGQIQEAYYLF
jgi:hypothetical protein